MGEGERTRESLPLPSGEPCDIIETSENASSDQSGESSSEDVTGVEDGDTCGKFFAGVEDGEQVEGAGILLNAISNCFDGWASIGRGWKLTYGASVTPRKNRVKRRPLKSFERAVRPLTTAHRAMQLAI